MTSSAAKTVHPARPHFCFTCERLNIASISGLSIAMAGFLWGNRLLPLSMAERTAWEVHVFFAIWALTLLHAMLRPARRAWIEQFWAAAALLAVLPVVSAIVTERPLWSSLIQGDWVFAASNSCVGLAGPHCGWPLNRAPHRFAQGNKRQADSLTGVPCPRFWHRRGWCAMSPCSPSSCWQALAHWIGRRASHMRCSAVIAPLATACSDWLGFALLALYGR